MQWQPPNAQSDKYMDSSDITTKLRVLIDLYNHIVARKIHNSQKYSWEVFYQAPFSTWATVQWQPDII